MTGLIANFAADWTVCGTIVLALFQVTIALFDSLPSVA